MQTIFKMPKREGTFLTWT